MRGISRYWRTLFIALFAAFTFVLCAVLFFDVETGELLGFFLNSLLALLILVAAAAFAFGLFAGLRALLHRGKDQGNAD